MKTNGPKNYTKWNLNGKMNTVNHSRYREDLVMKNYRVREGSIAWYVKKYGRLMAVVLLLVAISVAVITTSGTETAPQSEKKVKVDEVYAMEIEPSKTEKKALGVEDLICIECDKYGIDARLALAIARLETGHFTSDAYLSGNNVGGLSIDEEPMCFTSLERGVEAFVMNLYYNYYQEGLDTVDEIAPKYCPVNQEQWADTVKDLMN